MATKANPAAEPQRAKTLTQQEARDREREALRALIKRRAPLLRELAKH